MARQLFFHQISGRRGGRSSANFSSLTVKRLEYLSKTSDLVPIANTLYCMIRQAQRLEAATKFVARFRAPSSNFESFSGLHTRSPDQRLRY